jgi:hypothetical protein
LIAFALFVFDGVTRRNDLVGLYPSYQQEYEDAVLATDDLGQARAARYTTVRVAGERLVPRRRQSDATFVFLQLAAGAQTFQVRSPYYEPLDVTITLPAGQCAVTADADSGNAHVNVPTSATGTCKVTATADSGDVTVNAG